ncbi:MAG: S-layer homology domain-containing protein [Eubacteriales bacterium]
MNKTFKLTGLTLIALLLGVWLAVCASAADELYPDAVTGAYHYTFTDATPDTPYVILMLAGTYTPDESPVISDGNVLYYTQETSDSQGKLSLSFVPSSYQDGTVFIASGEFVRPQILFYAKAGDAKDIADFDIVLNQTVYTVKGDGVPVYVRYTVDAKDSFGFDTKLPSFAVRSLDNYGGDKIKFLADSDTLLLASDLEVGTYTFSISCGEDMVRSASFTVLHEPSAAAALRLTVDGEDRSRYYFECDTDLDGSFFDPASRLIEVQTLNQYGEPIADNYTYEYVETDADGLVIRRQLLSENGAALAFQPLRVPDIDEVFSCTVTVKSQSEPSLSAQALFTIVGDTSYTGTAKTLYLNLLKAKNYADMIESGDILICDSGELVPATKQWTTQANASRLYEEIDATEQLLAAHKISAQNDTLLTERRNKLDLALTSFERALLKGLYARIEALEFDRDSVDLALGKYAVIPVTVTPLRTSEKVSYRSENPAIASVSSSSGEVRALAEGSVRIFASNETGDICAYYDLHVYKPITSIRFNSKSLTLVAGASAELSVTVLPAAHSDEISFSSSDTDIAAVSDGCVYGRNTGSAVITASSKSGVTATFTVNVIKPRFAAPVSVRAKPGSRVSVTVSVADAYDFSSLSAEVSYNAEVLTFIEAQVSAFDDSYEGTVALDDGCLSSTWSFSEPTAQLSASFITYVFEVAEDAAYGNQTVEIALSAATADDEDILADGFAFGTVVTVGDRDTYTVSATAGTGGVVTGDGEYTYGTQVTLIAVSDKNYEFSGWYNGTTLLYSSSRYTFTVTEDLALTAKFAKTPPASAGGGGSSGGSGGGGGGSLGGGTVTKLEQVKPVTADIPGGLVQPGTKVTLSCATAGAIIYYTVDGTVPTAAGLRYSEPIEIVAPGLQIRAIAVKNGMTNSEIAGFSYRLPSDTAAEGVRIRLKDNAAQIQYVSSGSYFRPNDAATRYEVIDMLSELFDISGVSPLSVAFPDLSETYRGTVELYAAAGIINGYPDGTFGGERGITRAELVKILNIMLGFDKEELSGEETVSLSDISEHWAQSHIRKFVAKGYIVGYPEGDFRPDKSVTRAEVVTILNRVTGLVKVSGLPQRFQDLTPDFWAYDEIMNAAKPAAQSTGTESSEPADTDVQNGSESADALSAQEKDAQSHAEPARSDAVEATGADAAQSADA